MEPCAPVLSPWDFRPKGKTLWVANSGDDSGDGTANRPLRTIAKALDQGGPDDLIYLRTGVYVRAWTSTRSTTSVRFSNPR